MTIHTFPNPATLHSSIVSNPLLAGGVPGAALRLPFSDFCVTRVSEMAMAAQLRRMPAASRRETRPPFLVVACPEQSGPVIAARLEPWSGGPKTHFAAMPGCDDR